MATGAAQREAAYRAQTCLSGLGREQMWAFVDRRQTANGGRWCRSGRPLRVPAALAILVSVFLLSAVAASAAVPGVVGMGFHPFASGETNPDVDISVQKIHDVGANTVH